MVRLGALDQLELNHKRESFNSSMVRLGGRVCISPCAYFWVSIPVWCDWESLLPFPLNFLCGFNSSMVRLGVFRGVRRHAGPLVSIPVWCDWELPFRYT